MKVLYGCCYKGIINAQGCEITYIDIIQNLEKPNGKYICKDIKTVDFNDYDIIICTPPCNYYSKANYRRETSSYAQLTKELLPYCINSALETKKPFIIENVRNNKILNNIIKNFKYNVYRIGRHTYFTNMFVNIYVDQEKEDLGHINTKKRQGGKNVENVLNTWLESTIQQMNNGTYYI